MARRQFKVEYDREAHIWWTLNDTFGITTEADTLEALASRPEIVALEMVEENAGSLMAERCGPHDSRIVAHHEMERRAAA